MPQMLFRRLGTFETGMLKSPDRGESVSNRVLVRAMFSTTSPAGLGL